MNSQSPRPSSFLALSFAAGALFVLGGAVALAALASRRAQDEPRRPVTERRPRFLLGAPSLN
jgi:hypothetical protein